MNDDFSQMMTPFDQSISSHSLQMTKLLIPFLPPQSQRMMAVYVKFIEFQNAITYFRAMKQNSFEDLLSYLPRSATETYDNMINMMNMVNMMNMFQDMQNASDATAESGTDTGVDPMSMMKDMLTPEQQNMFQMYQGMFSQDIETQEQKEGDSYD